MQLASKLAQGKGFSMTSRYLLALAHFLRSECTKVCLCPPQTPLRELTALHRLPSGWRLTSPPQNPTSSIVLRPRISAILASAAPWGIPARIHGGSTSLRYRKQYHVGLYTLSLGGGVFVIIDRLVPRITSLRR